MFRCIVRVHSILLLGSLLGFLPSLCAADDRSSRPVAVGGDKAPDWSHYTTVGDVVGEVVKADATKLTVRVTWSQVSGGANPKRRPPLSANPRNFVNPYARGKTRPSQPRVKEQKHDYELEFTPETLVRSKKLPPKCNDKGNRVEYTQKELDGLLSPPGVPGYAAGPFDLEPGTVVEVILVRDKSTPAAKATEDDLRVKYAIILGKNPNASKDGEKSKDDKKGKKDKQ
jgi:hypothetical protein